MSSAQSQTSPKARLAALQSHFTWNLDASKPKLLRINDNLTDIGTDEGNSWLGHIFNLQGYVHFLLGNMDDARSFFSRATKAFSQTPQADPGPCLMVNYANLAWLHHHQGEETESQSYLSKIDELIKGTPPPSEDQLHPEVYAEKAWTLLKFSKEQKLLALDYFKKALKMQPDMEEWRSSYFIGLMNIHKHSDTELEADIMDELRKATEQDPENLYLAARYLDQRARGGERVQDEVRELATRILRNPVSSYSGIKAALRVYKMYDNFKDAIALAEEALENHPDARYLKRCAALCYNWKSKFSRNDSPTQREFERAIQLHKEVISLYPDSSFTKRMDLANVYAKSGNIDRADQIYKELLRLQLGPEEKQCLYNSYAKYLNFDRNDRNRSVDYHMKVARIPDDTFFRKNSIGALQKISSRGRNRRCREIAEFLDNLQE